MMPDLILVWCGSIAAGLVVAGWLVTVALALALEVVIASREGYWP